MNSHEASNGEITEWDPQDVSMIKQLLGPSAISHLSWNLQDLIPKGGQRLNEAALSRGCKALWKVLQ